jgi:hypothetical protein
MSSHRLFRLVVPACALGLALAAGTPVQAQMVLSITANFNSSAIPTSDTIWFNSVLSLVGTAPTTAFNVSFTGVTAMSSAFGTLPLPDAVIEFNPAATQATTTFAGGEWVTVVPHNWQWAAAVYTPPFPTTDNNALGVKPTDSTTLTALYPNGDHAGTPENFKADVTAGATGGGGSNFTGSYSGTAQVSLTATPGASPVPEPGPFVGAGVVTLMGLGYSWRRRKRTTA